MKKVTFSFPVRRQMSSIDDSLCRRVRAGLVGVIAAAAVGVRVARVAGAGLVAAHLKVAQNLRMMIMIIVVVVFINFFFFHNIFPLFFGKFI